MELNKIIFVAKKLIMENGQVYFDNYFATVDSINQDAIVVKKADGELENLPTDEDYYEPAEEGLYELADGNSQENPDYIAEFLIFENDAAYEKYKDDY